MSPTEITQIRQTLEVRRDELLAKTKAEIRDAIGKTRMIRDVSGEGDEGEEPVDVALSQMRSQMLTRIEAALIRIQDGTYGFCIDCEHEIETKRLLALAFAARCKKCEEADETRRRKEAVSGRFPGGMGLFALS
jgi:DnaK suppressor protein